MSHLFRAGLGLGLTTPFRIGRWEWGNPNRPGTGLWAFDKLYDSNGNLVDFYIGRPRLMHVSGGIQIRHRGLYGGGYPLYANARVCLKMAATKEGLGALDWSKPDDCVSLRGTNIRDITDHYASPTFEFKTVLEPGFYRVSAYASSGTTAHDEDWLAELASYGEALLHQFFVEVE